MSQEKIDELTDSWWRASSKLACLVCWLSENHLEVLKEYNKYSEDKESD